MTGKGTGDDGGRRPGMTGKKTGDDGGDGRSEPAMTVRYPVKPGMTGMLGMTRTDRHCRLDRQSQKDYLYIRKTIGYGAEGICVFYDEWE